MKLVMFFVAAIGLFIAEAMWRSPAKEADDDVGLFVGSARPLAAKALVKPSPQVARRSQKRAQLV